MMVPEDGVPSDYSASELAAGPPSSTPTALLGSADLMLSSALAAPARKYGWQLVTSKSWDDVLWQVSHEHVQLLLIDLTFADLPLTPERVALLRSWGIRVIAFGPHVHRDRLEHARQCGCDAVISRGELHHTAENYFAAPPA